jgi:hypothetical protein
MYIDKILGIDLDGAWEQQHYAELGVFLKYHIHIIFLI